MSHYEDDFARHHMQAKHKRENKLPKGLDLTPIKISKHDQKIMDIWLESWDDLVIDELKINN
tara:strand:- start:329 stop:514 length:186 start_codon:yes stop_codon:yes gene_type:complete